MDTSPIRFDFVYDGRVVPQRTHDIPTSLFTGASVRPPPSDPAYYALFYKAMSSAMTPDVKLFTDFVGGPCVQCGEPGTRTFMGYKSCLHLRDEDPFVKVLIKKICSSEACEMAACLAEKAMGDQVGAVEAMFCRVCGAAEGIKKCGGCLVVGYCGRKHRKEDWAAHKLVCVPKLG